MTDEDTGEPIPYAHVMIYDATNPNFILTEGTTDQKGIYETVSRLHAGNYKARVSDPLYLSRYYGGSLDFSSANAISVTDGLTTTNANISLLSIDSPRLSTHLRLPIVMRQMPEIFQIAPTPLVYPSSPFNDAASP